MGRLRAAFISPASLLLLALFIAPLLLVIAYSFLVRGPYGGLTSEITFENYVRLVDPLYGRILLRSILMAFAVTAACLVLGFPLALFITRSGPRKNLFLQMVILPFWTSFLVRTYAWIFLLRDTGLVNSTLMSVGLIREPLPLLYNDGAVFVGLVYSHLPFAVLPLFATLERLDKSFLEAAADLGSRPWQTMLHVLIPLSAPGIRAAGILAFVPSLGAFLTPDLLGGGKSVMIGTLIQNQFTTARDWPFGSALSLVVMIAVTLAVVTFLRKGGEETL